MSTADLQEAVLATRDLKDLESLEQIAINGQSSSTKPSSQIYLYMTDATMTTVTYIPINRWRSSKVLESL